MPKQKGDSIFESSLANAFLYLLLAAHGLGLAAQPVSGVKYPSVQGHVKHLLNLPDYIYVYDLVLAGWSAMDKPVAGKLTRGAGRDGPPRPGRGRRVPRRGGAARVRS